MANTKPLVFNTTTSGCFVPISHKLNQDGYFRKYIVGLGRVMFHRVIWELRRGPIPEGFEIDHACKNRACSNVEHLRCIPGDQHAIESNQQRYLDRKEEAHGYWMNNVCTGTHLAQVFDVSVSQACRWIKEWKKEVANGHPAAMG